MRRTSLVSGLIAAVLGLRAQVPAFPGAEGFGADTPGGRGGDVYHVTNLNDSGPGSLRAGIQTATGPRTIVFDVSGTIQLQSRLSINKPFLTIAGQTAPGEGITLAGWNTVVSGTHDVIVRYLRFRPGDTNCPRYQEDSFTVDNSTSVIVDHVSASWSLDETLSVTDSDRVTVQWSLITESLNNSCHEKGAHGYGSLLRYGKGGLTFHHNLYAHHQSRNPRIGDELSVDFVNNVIYDHGGEAGYSGEASEGVTRLNYIGNYVIAGPATSASRRNRAFLGGSENTHIYQSGNRIDGNLNKVRDGVDTGWSMFAGAFTRQAQRFDFPQIGVDDAPQAYARVLELAGASLVRDAVDRRIVTEVTQESGRIIDSQIQVGGWPQLASRPGSPDTDQDGIPDFWEITHGLDPHDPNDAAALTPAGYTNLEICLNELVSPPVVSTAAAIRLAPANLDTGVCADTLLAIQFDQPVKTGSRGRIRVHRADGALVDTVDLAAQPQTRIIGGVSFNYFPVIATGDTASIYLHQPLAYGESYYVTMEPGVLSDLSGAPLAGFSDPRTWWFTVCTASPAAASSALTVAADGSGDFCTIQGAIDSVSSNNTQPVTITVQPGTYTEINYVPSNKPFLTIRGAGRNAAVVQYANNANLNAGSSRAIFGVDAPDFTLEDITLRNTTPKGGSQAEAFRGNNQRILLNRVSLSSFQDTLLLEGTAMVTDSFIEGDVDFMWGNGTVFFQNSELCALSSGGYYAQIRNLQERKGNVYVNCRLTAPDNVSGVYLARIDPNVYPYSQVVFVNSAMGRHIHPAGWLLNNASTAPSVQFWEYKSGQLDGSGPVDVSGRLISSRQLSDPEAAQWSDPLFVLGWVPYTISAAATGSTLVANWTAPPGHSAKDWVGLYEAGAADTAFLAWLYTGPSHTGRLTFPVPQASSGRYEFRMFKDDGFARLAQSGAVVR